MIKLNKVSFAYGEKEVLKALSFTFPDKGIFALMGESGEGKTTLLRLLCGLEKPSAGELISSHRKVAVSFQEPRLLPWLDCENNIKFVLPKEKQGSDIAEKLLHDFELDGYAKKLPNALSGGMKQRLSLARALAVEADLLLLDEPFSALDAALKERVAALVKRANPEGLTIIVTHDKKDAELLGAKVLKLTSVPLSALTE